MIAILNSTLVALFKTFYGRYAGTEGNLKTEVIDVNMLEVPTPKDISIDLAKKLSGALKRMCKRDVGHLVEEQLRECHSPERARRLGAGPLLLPQELRQPDRRELDDAVFEMLGVTDSDERAKLIDRLYDATARHFREIRVVEIEKMEQRKKSKSKGINTNDQAADIWDAAELSDTAPLAEWLTTQVQSEAPVHIPEDRPVRLGEPMFSPNVVYFGTSRRNHQEFVSREQAELVAYLAQLGVNGSVPLPAAGEEILALKAGVSERIARARARFKELAESRSGEESVRELLVQACERWFVLGRKGSKK